MREAKAGSEQKQHPLACRFSFRRYGPLWAEQAISGDFPRLHYAPEIAPGPWGVILGGLTAVQHASGGGGLAALAVAHLFTASAGACRHLWGPIGT
jgi:hypothetical protein